MSNLTVSLLNNREAQATLSTYEEHLGCKLMTKMSRISKLEEPPLKHQQQTRMKESRKPSLKKKEKEAFPRKLLTKLNEKPPRPLRKEKESQLQPQLQSKKSGRRTLKIPVLICLATEKSIKVREIPNSDSKPTSHL
jgi:hypothetical protein